MPLSPPAARALLHTRQIECRAYRRDDGLVDVEGHIEDLRAFGWHSHWGADQQVPAETPVHGMWVRLTIDGSKVIQGVEVAMDHTPFPHCTGVPGNYQRLVGLKVEAGFMRQMHERVGGVEGCTHVTGLIPTMTTTLLQALATEIQRWEPGKDLVQVWREKGTEAFGGSDTPDYPLLNTCWSHDARSPVVKVLAPLRYQGDGCNE